MSLSPLGQQALTYGFAILGLLVSRHQETVQALSDAIQQLEEVENLEDALHNLALLEQCENEAFSALARWRAALAEYLRSR